MDADARYRRRRQRIDYIVPADGTAYLLDACTPVDEDADTRSAFLLDPATTARAVLPAFFAERGIDALVRDGHLAIRGRGSADAPVVVKPEHVAERVVAAAAALDERAVLPGVLRHWRTLATDLPDVLAEHVAAAVRSVCRGRYFAEWTPPRRPRPARTAPALTSTERSRRSRDRARAEEVAAARWALDEIRRDRPGERLTHREIYDLVVALLAEPAEALADVGDDYDLDDLADDYGLPYGLVPRVPRERVLSEVLRAAFGEPRRSRGVARYVVAAVEPVEAAVAPGVEATVDPAVEPGVECAADEQRANGWPLLRTTDQQFALTGATDPKEEALP